MNEDIDKLLHKIYYDAKNPASFGGVKKLYKQASLHNPNITYKKIKDWLSGEFTYTLHKPIRHNFKRNPTVVSAIDEQWQADLVDMQEFSKSNDNFKYIITIIDILSKFAWAIPIKNKSANSVLEAFKKVFINRIPAKLQTDQGKEFDNNLLKNYLKKYSVHYFTSKNPKTKCSIVERFNRTLKGKMFKYFTSKGTRKYIDILPELLKSYNNSYHRSIKMRPVDVNFNNQHEVFSNIYGYKDIMELYRKKTKENNFKVEDSLRLPHKMNVFDKSYYPLWEDKIHKLKNILKGNKYPLFKVKDDNKTLPRRYYREEIQKVKPKLHRVEKVIKKRYKNKKLELYIKWLNHPSSSNSWVAAKDVYRL